MFEPAFQGRFEVMGDTILGTLVVPALPDLCIFSNPVWRGSLHVCGIWPTLDQTDLLGKEHVPGLGSQDGPSCTFPDLLCSYAVEVLVRVTPDYELLS